MRTTVRLATEDDAPSILAIYDPIVRETAISFEVEPPTASAMRGRIADTLETLPWLVCETDGFVAGFAYASRHRQRVAYQWAVDVSVYVHPDAQRRGIGRHLYEPLFEILRVQNYFGAYAGIVLPNPGSVALHESLGFVPVGTYHRVGFKLGSWRDVGWWQLELRPRDSAPEPPRPLRSLLETAEFLTILGGCQ